MERLHRLQLRQRGLLQRRQLDRQPVELRRSTRVARPEPGTTTAPADLPRRPGLCMTAVIHNPGQVGWGGNGTEREPSGNGNRAGTGTEREREPSGNGN